MPPAKTLRAAARRPQPSVFRITKASTLNTQIAPVTKQKLQAIEESVLEQEQPKFVSVPASSHPRKRRRDTPSTSDSEKEGAVIQVEKQTKKAKLQQITPPSTPKAQRILESHAQLSTITSSNDDEKTPTGVPEVLVDLQLLHKIFVQSLSIHYAHRGLQTAVPLAELVPTMTRLYKKHSVSQQDIERVLAIWELAARRQVVPTGDVLEHHRGPFRLITSGIGKSARTVVEFAWAASSHAFNEQDLQERYETACTLLAGVAQGQPNSFLWESTEKVPRLAPFIGQQTQQKQAKVNSIRSFILNKTPRSHVELSATNTSPRPTPELSFSDLKISTSPKKSSSAQSKTLSLFDRVKAKQLLASSTTNRTSAEILRRRALARLPDIVEVLRLKQAQKLNSQFSSAIHGSPSKTRTRMKTCFSMDALVQEIQDSMSVAVSADELGECISILGREMKDGWCSTFVSGGVRCVTLQGEGPSGREVKAWVQQQLESSA